MGFYSAIHFKNQIATVVVSEYILVLLIFYIYVLSLIRPTTLVLLVLLVEVLEELRVYLRLLHENYIFIQNEKK
jgi:hypothetical protein